MNLLDHCPRPPEWTVDWSALDRSYGWVRDLAGCIQDPVFHAEGDVWIHTRMVLEALAADPAFRALDEADRRVAFAACALHDVAKPATTRVEDGRVTSRGHSERGDNRARVLLWEEGVPIAAREAVAGLVRWHQLPFFLLERDRPERTLYRISQATRCDLLTIVARADAAGRSCTDQSRILENVELFQVMAEERGCARRPMEFPDAHTRFVYFRDPGRSAEVVAHDDTRCEVILMAGLPGAGKDTWVEAHAGDRPVVSLDRIRRERRIRPDGPQGEVVAAAREEARTHLRRGASFVWNATNLSRRVRRQCIDLFADYRARVRVVHVETDPGTLRERNLSRPHPVPWAVVEALLGRWQVPDLSEAHAVELLQNS